VCPGGYSSFSVKVTRPKEIISPVDLNNLIDKEFVTSLDCHDPKRSLEDQKFISTLQQGIRKTSDGHFEMPLPFRDANPALPNNRIMAEKRLEGLKRKFTKDIKYREEYSKFNTLPQSSQSPVVPDSDPELKQVRSLITKQGSDDNMTKHWSRFSSWERLRKAVAHCLQYKRILQQRVKARENKQDQDIKTEMNVELICGAERVILKSTQREHLSAEIKRLQTGRHTAGKEQSGISKLDPYLDEYGLLRVGGRLHQSSLSPELKHPVILPRDNHVSDLLVRHIHERARKEDGKRKKWTHPERNMAVGDVVMLKESDCPRNVWPLAIVEAIHPSEDGKVRKVTVRVADQQMTMQGTRTKAQSVLHRPVHKCVLLHEANTF